MYSNYIIILIFCKTKCLNVSQTIINDIFCMFYVLCIMYNVLCIMYYVLCIMYYVLCIMHSVNFTVSVLNTNLCSLPHSLPAYRSHLD